MAPINNILNVLEVLPSPYLVLKCNTAKDYTILGTNSAYLRHIDPNVKTAASLADHLPFSEPLFSKKLYKLLAQSCEEKKNITFSYQTVHAGYKIEITPVNHDEENEQVLLLNFIVQHETETELVHSDKHYYAFLDNLMEGCQIIGFDWKYIYINTEAARQGHYEQSYYIGRSIMELYPGIEQSELYSILHKCMHEHTIEKTETEFAFNDGSRPWFDLHIYPHKDGIFILSLDITKRKKHEEELRKSEHKFRSLYEHSVDMIVLFDTQLRIRYKSPSTQKHIGWSDDELRQLDLLDLVHEEDRTALTAIHRAVKEVPENPLPVSARVKHKNGQYIWLEGSVTNLLHDDAIEGVVLSMRDITERKQAETSLIKSERELRQTQEIARLGYLHFDLAGEGSYWSDEIFVIWERDKKDFKPGLGSFKETIHPADRYRFEEFLARLSSDLLHREIEYRIVVPDGNIKYIFQRTEVDYDTTGRIVSINGIVLNVTERRRTEIALKESDDKFKTLFNSSPLPQWLYDTDTLQFIDVNDAAIKNYGYSRSEFLSMTLTDIRPKEEVEKFLNARKQILADEEMGIVNNQYRYFIHLKKDGSLINVDIKASNVLINGKKARLAIARDITAELAFEKQLLESNERYNLVLEATNESVIDWDIVNDITIWGKGFENNFGYDLGKYDNHLWSNNIYHEDRPRVLADLEQTLGDKHKRYFDAAFRYVKANGDLAYIQHRGIILRDHTGKAVRAIGAMIDVTELNEKMAEIEHQNERLRDIAWIQSHVVRAPVARIMGLINLLENKNFSVNSTYNLSEILSYIVHSAYELDDIIKDIVKKSEKYKKHEFKSPDHR